MQTKILVGVVAVLGIALIVMGFKFCVLNKEVAEYKEAKASTDAEIERLKSIVNYFATQSGNNSGSGIGNPGMTEPGVMPITMPGGSGVSGSGSVEPTRVATPPIPTMAPTMPAEPMPDDAVTNDSSGVETAPDSGVRKAN